MPLVEILGKIKNLIGSLTISNNSFVNVDNRTLNVTINNEVLGSLSKKQKETLANFIEEYTENGAYLIRSESAEKKIRELNGVTSSANAQNLIEFINTKLPKSDRAVWIAAVALKQAHERGDREQCAVYKRDISVSHGERGRNIANLCSSGYLEEFIMPLYDQAVNVLRKEGLFLEMYDTFVQEFQFIVFVSGEMSIDSLQDSIKSKILSMQNYGFHELHINAIGNLNVKKAKTAVTAVVNSMGDLLEPYSTRQDGVIIRILLPIKSKSLL